MPLIAKLPFNKSFTDGHGVYPTHLNVLSRKKNAVQRQIRRGGLGSFETDFQACLLALCETSVDRIRFFDIGAHMGLYSALVSTIFRSANPYVVAVEPTPDTARDARLLRRANGLQYTIVEAAVSDTHGEVLLHLSDKSEASNSLNPNFRKGSDAVRVPLTTLDRLVNNGFAPPTIIKIDVETLEASVLRGGLSMIQEYRPIVTLELLPKIEPEAIGAMLKAIEHLGYSFYQVTPDRSWESHDAEQVLSQLSSVHRDWVCAPTELTNEFFDARMVWRDALTLCGKPTNVLIDAGLPVAEHVMGTVGHT